MENTKPTNTLEGYEKQNRKFGELEARKKGTQLALVKVLEDGSREIYKKIEWSLRTNQ